MKTLFTKPDLGWLARKSKPDDSVIRVGGLFKVHEVNEEGSGQQGQFHLRVELVENQASGIKDKTSKINITKSMRAEIVSPGIIIKN